MLEKEVFEWISKDIHQLEFRSFICLLDFCRIRSTENLLDECLDFFLVDKVKIWQVNKWLEQYHSIRWKINSHQRNII